MIKESSKKKEVAKKKPTDTKKIETKLRTILSNVKQYKDENQLKTNKLREELTAMRKEFNQYKVKKSRELKKVKNKLDSTNKELKYNKKKLVKIQKKIPKKELTSMKKEFHQEVKTRKVVEKEKPLVHKVIHKMQPIRMYDTPWIEITVQDNINIYDLALKYYGDSQEYKKIYTANKDVIDSNYQINDGMSLIIPITETFQEQPIMLNTD